MLLWQILKTIPSRKQTKIILISTKPRKIICVQKFIPQVQVVNCDYFLIVLFLLVVELIYMASEKECLVFVCALYRGLRRKRGQSAERLNPWPYIQRKRLTRFEVSVTLRDFHAYICEYSFFSPNQWIYTSSSTTARFTFDSLRQHH